MEVVPRDRHDDQADGSSHQRGPNDDAIAGADTGSNDDTIFWPNDDAHAIHGWANNRTHKVRARP